MLLRLLPDRMNNPKALLCRGSVCLVLGIAPGLFLPASWHAVAVHAVAGVFLGMSLVLNLRFVAQRKRNCAAH